MWKQKKYIQKTKLILNENKELPKIVSRYFEIAQSVGKCALFDMK